MTNLITISGVSAFIDENGTAQLNAENICRGLGFVQIKNNTEYVRWERVNGYLSDMGFPHLVGKEFYPENVFYRLAMKGETDSAQKFQGIVADEILPAIRKTGTYSAKPQLLTRMQVLEIALAAEKKVLELETTITEQKPKVVFAESVECSKGSILVKGLSVILKQNGMDVGQNRLFEILRNEGYLSRQRGYNYNKPTQRSLDLKVMEEKTTTINKPDREPIVSQTPLITGKGQLYFVNKFLSKEVQVL